MVILHWNSLKSFFHTTRQSFSLTLCPWELNKVFPQSNLSDTVVRRPMNHPEADQRCSVFHLCSACSLFVCMVVLQVVIMHPACVSLFHLASCLMKHTNASIHKTSCFRTKWLLDHYVYMFSGYWWLQLRIAFDYVQDILVFPYTPDVIAAWVLHVWLRW